MYIDGHNLYQSFLTLRELTNYKVSCIWLLLPQDKKFGKLVIEE